jgi:hypothetical protein
MEGEQLMTMDRDSFDLIVGRNETVIRDQFEADPSKILVAVQLEDDQIEHLNSGLMKRSRRLVPLPLLAELIARYNSR